MIPVSPSCTSLLPGFWSSVAVAKPGWGGVVSVEGSGSVSIGAEAQVSKAAGELEQADWRSLTFSLCFWDRVGLEAAARWLGWAHCSANRGLSARSPCSQWAQPVAAPARVSDAPPLEFLNSGAQLHAEWHFAHVGQK